MPKLTISRIAFLAGAGLGAGLTYVLEPTRIRRLRQNASGDRHRSRPVSNSLLAGRVRAAVARAASYPHAIDVTVDQGRVILSGPVLQREGAEILRRVARVAGVREIDNQLDEHGDSDHFPGLEGPIHSTPRGRLERDVWSPVKRLGAWGAAVTLGALGLRHGGRTGLGMAAGGALLGARAALNRPVSRLLGFGGSTPAVDLRKTTVIRAPIGDVFRFWAQVENFPLFMEHVLEVTIDPNDGRRSHWQVRGPAGVPVSWDAEVTRLVPDALFAWKTLPGSGLEHAGAVHFEELGEESTWVQVRMIYVPPAGAFGHVIATILGADPETRMDEDLARLKSLLEDLHTLDPTYRSAARQLPDVEHARTTPGNGRQGVER